MARKRGAGKQQDMWDRHVENLSGHGSSVEQSHHNAHHPTNNLRNRGHHCSSTTQRLLNRSCWWHRQKGFWLAQPPKHTADEIMAVSNSVYQALDAWWQVGSMIIGRVLLMSTLRCVGAPDNCCGRLQLVRSIQGCTF